MYFVNILVNLFLFAAIAVGLGALLWRIGYALLAFFSGRTLVTRVYPFLMQNHHGMSLSINEQASEYDLEDRRYKWNVYHMFLFSILLLILARFQPPMEFAFSLFGHEFCVWTISIIAAIFTAFMFAFLSGRFKITDSPIMVVKFLEYNPETDIAKYQICMPESWIGSREEVVEVVCDRDEDFIASHCHNRYRFVMADTGGDSLDLMDLDTYKWLSGFRGYD